MPTHRSKEEWEKIVSDYKTSGLSRAKFSISRGIKESTLEYHIAKHRKSKFVELKSAERAAKPLLRLELPGGAVFSLEW